MDVELASEAELTEAECAPEWPTEANGAAGLASPINGVGRAVGGVADLPGARASGPGTDGAAGDGVMTPPKRFAHRKLSEAALTPTMVGVPPPEGAGPPVIVSPPRVDGQPSDSGIKQPGTGPRSAGHRVLATVGPVPSAPDIPASSPPAPAEASEAPTPSSPKNNAAAASTEPPPSGADTVEASSPSTAAE